jgi:hypothetical protein
MIWGLEQNEIAILILAFFGAIFFIWIAVLHYRFARLVKGSTKKSIEDSIVNIYKYIEGANIESKKVNAVIATLQKQMQKSPRGFGIVNFKAFEGVKSGGSNSFAVAFVNDGGNGIVLSTFHARDRVNVFSKEIKAFKSEIMLTEEEQSALTKAKESLSLS